MKKIGLIGCGLGFSTLVSAAQVSVITPATGSFSSDSALTYMFGSRDQITQLNITNDISSPAYVNIRDAFGVVDPSVNGGEELIFLGAHETINLATDNTLSVTLESSHGMMTGGVSLVLSAAAALEWDLSFDSNLVKLNNIFVFSAAAAGQTVTVNGQSLLPGTNVQNAGSTTVSRSTSGYCGYLVPQDDQGCFTDLILGLNQITLDEFGDPIETNEFGINALDNLTSLDVTNFNGSYLVDAFHVAIDSKAIPLPGALILYGCGLGLLSISRLRKLS